ncbi:MAG: acetate--CoA ligase [Acidimicrobiia bacterium]
METQYPVIEKSQPLVPPPNLGSYTDTYEQFSWDAAEQYLDGVPGGGWNIAHETTDRHVPERGDRVAIRWLGRRGDVREYTFAELAELSSRFASGLRRLGIGKGDRVFILSPRIPELYVAVLGTLKNGSVASPLFSAFGPEPIETRLKLGRGKVLVTTESLYKRKVAGIRDRLTTLEHVVLVGSELPGTLSFDALLKDGDPSMAAEPMDAEDMALLHFTSGTTGTPKGAVHVHRAVLHHYVSAKYALDLREGDVYWCTADPGWVTGMSYGIVAPLSHGITSIVDEGEFDPDRWYQTIQDQRISVWYTAPTAIRMLMMAGESVAAQYDLSSLRFVASVGEPLNPEAVVWGERALGLPIHDNWWQTETGGIMIANYIGEPIRPGSMGRPLPGIAATLLRRDTRGQVRLNPDGSAEEETTPLTEGELALRPSWPSMFRGYLGMEERYAETFVGGWYKTGDIAERDEDGYFWFVGRGDDVIKSSGHLIGPFEVESALIEHEAVAEAGVIGKPDPVAGEVVKAFVALNAGYEWSRELEKDLIAWGRVKLGASVAPREVELCQDLPHTRSGKIMRRLLKAWELGLPTGDLSTLEGEESE